MSQRWLLALVRAALWNKKPDISLISYGPIDWNEIGSMAMDQTVGALAFSSILDLPTDVLPPEEWRRKVLAFIEKNRRTHLLVDRCVAASVESLRKSGIHPVLLKGQDYARAYPASELRQCGDIDLYVGEADYSKSYHIAKGLGWKEMQDFYPHAKHCGFSVSGVRIELHRVASILSQPSANRIFQKWSHNQLSFRIRDIEIDNRLIQVPSPLFDVVFVFLHLYNHFIHGGIGLRHICDWTMLLHIHSHEIDASELHKILKDFRLLKGWKAFTPIAVDHLGLPEEECPFYSIENRKKSERVLTMIMKEGNFGRACKINIQRPKGYIAGKIHSLSLNTLRMMKKISIDPHTILRTYLSYIYKGLARVFNDTIKGEK